MSTPVLDQGYVDLVETWGSDESIVEAARMSTGKGFQGCEIRQYADVVATVLAEKFPKTMELFNNENDNT